ncbi:glycosyltransferase family 4 protein [Novosphingobium soli]|uniref:Glycosyltransferase family 4 protein n=1 Tax=Novosphingobium soli TaxID=574956 RepID=A0ABV6CXZ4_9SPHN
MSQPAGEMLINGRFLTQPITGVQRVARAIVTEMDRLAGEGGTPLRIALACEPAADLSDLPLRHIAVECRGGASGHLWEQLILPRMARGRTLLCLGNTAPLAALLGPARVAVMLHDVSYLALPRAYAARYRWAHRALLPFVLRRADPVLTVSVTEAERLKRLRGRGRGRVVPAQNGAWSDDPIAPCGDEADRREATVLYLGSLSRRKNVDRVIAVAHRLAREDGVRTVLVGTGNDILAPIRARVAPDVASMITFLGQVPCRKALAAHYRRASCLLFPSLYEASPLPPLEAMSLGCPVVASAIPAMTERCGAAALYCDPRDEEDMLAAVRRVLREPALAEALRRKGLAQAARFSWRGQAERILAAVCAP